MKKIILFSTIAYLIAAISAGAEVIPTNEWMNFWSDSTYLDGSPVQPGDIIDVYDPDGTHCGTETVTSSGTYPLISVYRDDPLTSSVDEGAEPGDSLTFKINENNAQPFGPGQPYWTSHGDVQKLNLVARTAIPPVSDLRASVVGENILLEWSPMPEATEYNVYRGTSYDFVPDKTNGTNRIAEKITDQDPGTDGIQWTDTGNGADIVGDVNTNYFYRVTGFIPGSGISSRGTPVDYKPSGTPHTATGRVFNYDYSVPGDGDIQFEAYIIGRDDEVLTESSTGCEYKSGYWKISVGNFPTAWSEGETLYVDLQNTLNGETGNVQVIMTSSGSDQAEDAILSSIVESDPSNVAGEFDYSLTTTPITDINEIVLFMDTRDTKLPITTAEELAQAIPYCTDVYYWVASGQGTDGHPKGLPFGNFPVYQGYPYMVNIIKDTIWTAAGKLPDTSFTLITTGTTDINHIGIPTGKENLTDAESLGLDISNCTDVYYWDTAGQGFDGHVIGLPFGNFQVKMGYPYYVNVTQSTVWPPENAGSAKLMLIQNEQLLCKNKSEGGNIPHTVYGKLKCYDGSKIEDNNIKITAWITERPNEILTRQNKGVGSDGDYWWVNVGNFPSTWNIEDNLQVILQDENNGYEATVSIMLSSSGSDDAGVIILSETVELKNQSLNNVPNDFILMQNYPNPFNPETNIRFGLTKAENIKIQIYDVKGSLVQTLLNERIEKGFHKVTWDGCDLEGIPVSSGLYFCKLIFSHQTKVIKLVLSK